MENRKNFNDNDMTDKQFQVLRDILMEIRNDLKTLTKYQVKDPRPSEVWEKVYPKLDPSMDPKKRPIITSTPGDKLSPEGFRKMYEGTWEGSTPMCPQCGYGTYVQGGDLFCYNQTCRHHLYPIKDPAPRQIFDHTKESFQREITKDPRQTQVKEEEVPVCHRHKIPMVRVMDRTLDPSIQHWECPKSGCDAWIDYRIEEPKDSGPRPSYNPIMVKENGPKVEDFIQGPDSVVYGPKSNIHRYPYFEDQPNPEPITIEDMAKAVDKMIEDIPSIHRGPIPTCPDHGDTMVPGKWRFICPHPGCVQTAEFNQTQPKP